MAPRRGAVRRVIAVLVIVSVLALAGCSAIDMMRDQGARGARTAGEFSGRTLVVRAGSASKPPTEEIAALFEARTGATIELTFGGSGKMLSELEISGLGDVYFPGSSDWMDVAKQRGLIEAGTEQQLVFLVNSINVPRGNPKNIHTLEDLLRSDVRVAIANPESVCVGSYGVEVLEKNLTSAQTEQFRTDNLVNYTDSCESVANAVSLGAVDAVIGWSVFEAWDPKRIETVDLEPEQLSRIAFIPIAVTTKTSDPELARAFVEFAAASEARSVFRKHGYFVEEREAQEYVEPGGALPVGGTYDVPDVWLGQ